MRATRRGFVVMCVLGMIAFPFASPIGKNILYLTSSATVVIALGVGIKANRPSDRSPWFFALAAFFWYLMGDSLAVLLEHTMGDATPFPSFADAAYVIFYPLMFISLGRFLRATGNKDRSAWVDASVWTLAVAILVWEPLIEPYVIDSEAGILAYIAAMAYPLLDLGLLLIVLRMLAGRSSLHPSYLLLSAAMLIQVAIDFVYSVRVVEGTYASGELTEVGWMLISFLVGAAALSPSMVRLTLRATHKPILTSRRRLQMAYAPAFFAPALLIYQLAHSDLTGQIVDGVFTAAAMITVLVLVTGRGGGLVAVAERQSEELRERTGSLETALQAGDTVSRELRRRVDRDTLTGLASRDRFVEILRDEVTAWRAGGLCPSIAFLDLDDFKNVNDTLGHEAGDLLLIEVAARLRGSVGADQVVARFGGDEFALIVHGDAEIAAKRILDVLRPPVLLNGRELRPEISIGVTTAAGQRCSPSDMLREADVAMYEAKRAGGGWARYQAGMSAILLERLDLHTRLVEALQNGEIVPWFQPVVDLDSGALLGFEALARWCPVGKAVLAPDRWFSLAEETGLVTSVDRAILRQAIAQLALWRATFNAHDLDLAVNLSGRTLQQPEIEVEILDALRDRGVPPNRLVVEVTEGVLIEDEQVGRRLQHLRSAGVRIALDDFGTGWSSLTYLRRFPVDQIKLDRSFTAELGTSIGTDAIPAAIIQLARGLSLDAVAEGVETIDQRHRLTALGFTHAQGYLFGRAQRAAFYDDWVRNSGRASAAALLRPVPIGALRRVK